MKSKTLLILNGSLRGGQGNCGLLIRYIQKKYAKDFKIIISHLKSDTRMQVEKKLGSADALLFITGTYWESWGSPMQKFLEECTDLEASKAFVGKPASFIVLSHSTGGKSVLSRMQANMNLFGCLLPPFCGIELSMVNLELLKEDPKNSHKDDLWQIDDLEIIFRNLQRAVNAPQQFEAWPVDKKNFRKKWIKLP